MLYRALSFIAAHLKCKCPEHVELRQKTKSINFLLCYGGGPDALADELGITVDAAKELMRQHEAAFPDVWGYFHLNLMHRIYRRMMRYVHVSLLNFKTKQLREPTKEESYKLTHRSVGWKEITKQHTPIEVL